MSEWNTGTKPCKLSLTDFVRKVKGDRYRLKKFQEKLEWVEHLFYSVPGPVYDKVGGSSNVRPDPFIELLDRKWRIEEEMKKIGERKTLLDSFLSSLTDRENYCFKLHFLMDLNQTETAYRMGISQQAVNQKLGSIEKKWNKDYK